MTRKDYEQVAGAFKRELDTVRGNREYGATDSEALERIAQRLADVFAFDNPRFARARFMRACGFAESGHRRLAAAR